MISVAEAWDIIDRETPRGPVAERVLAEALGGVLAGAIVAPIDLPAFDNSAMDGYALRHAETARAAPDAPVRFPLAGAQLAGPITCRTLPPGHAALIATGARIPDGATAMIPLEAVTRETDHIVLTKPVAAGHCIRRQGEEIRRGATALAAGTALTPAALGFLAGLGITHAPAIAAPTIAVIPTGSELIVPGAALVASGSSVQAHSAGEGEAPWALPMEGDKSEPCSDAQQNRRFCGVQTTRAPVIDGHVYESNTVALGAALSEFGIAPRCFAPVPDDPDRLDAALTEAMHGADIVLVTGGCSVGSADYLRERLRLLDVQPLFWRVRQKPGMPLYCGRRGDRLVFGLPGNPVSSLVCYYEYVRRAIRQWMGCAAPGLPSVAARLQSAIAKGDGKTHFLRARVSSQEGEIAATPIGVQASHRMAPFAGANGLIVIPAEVTRISAGARVVAHLLPGMAPEEMA
ncbi:MAG: molybdopterin molybdotransferase MoeA [Deltaproteobacteria bacterium]|nr:molybdopterin molybdotransferase MoeA [Deltaproteobacteria bacterium]